MSKKFRDIRAQARAGTSGDGLDGVSQHFRNIRRMCGNAQQRASPIASNQPDHPRLGGAARRASFCQPVIMPRGGPSRASAGLYGLPLDGSDDVLGRFIRTPRGDDTKHVASGRTVVGSSAHHAGQHCRLRRMSALRCGPSAGSPTAPAPRFGAVRSIPPGISLRGWRRPRAWSCEGPS